MERKGKEEEEFTLMDELNVDRSVVMDLSDNGERWEGDLLNGFPFGYGYVHNSENELVYSGFMYKGERAIFGEEFEKSVIQYCGTYYKNQRHGIGTVYNLKGEFICEGKWYFGRNNMEDVGIACELCDGISVHSGIEKLIIGDNYNSDLEELRLNDFPFLKTIHIGDNCFSRVKVFEVFNCMKLETMVIGENKYYECYYLSEEEGHLVELSYDTLREIMSTSSFHICNHFELRSIGIKLS